MAEAPSTASEAAASASREASVIALVTAIAIASGSAYSSISFFGEGYVRRYKPDPAKSGDRC